MKKSILIFSCMLVLFSQATHASTASDRYQAILEGQEMHFAVAPTTIDEAFITLNGNNIMGKMQNPAYATDNFDDLRQRILADKLAKEKDPEMREEIKERMRVGLHTLREQIRHIRENKEFGCDKI